MWLKYSDAPIMVGEWWSPPQKPAGEYRSHYDKPIGYWITDDSEDCWASWCRNNDFGLDQLTHKHEIVLDESNLLILRSLSQFDFFNQEWGSPYYWGGANGNKFRDWCIDWWRVAERYDGLIITPYKWQRRLQLNWYYSWDCASGCIWNVDAVKDIRLIEINMEIARKIEAA